jgi:hypothetical protein
MSYVKPQYNPNFYGTAFKGDAVKFSYKPGENMSSAARLFGCTATSIKNWRKTYGSNGKRIVKTVAFPPAVATVFTYVGPVAKPAADKAIVITCGRMTTTIKADVISVSDEVNAIVEAMMKYA